MPATLKIRDAVTGNIVIDEQMLIGRYLTNLTLAWNDKIEHIVYHDGFLQGTPFFQVYNPNSHYLNAFSSVFGNHSHIAVRFEGNKAICQQIFASGVTDTFVDIKKDVVIHFGIY